MTDSAWMAEAEEAAERQAQQDEVATQPALSPRSLEATHNLVEPPPVTSSSRTTTKVTRKGFF